MKNKNFKNGCYAATKVIGKIIKNSMCVCLVAAAAGLGISLAWDIAERRELKARSK